MATLCNQSGGDNGMPARTDDYYEQIASQEEIYLEEIEEELRMILESDDPLPSPRTTIVEERAHVVEELISGDADDPPLSDRTVTEMLRI